MEDIALEKLLLKSASLQAWVKQFPHRRYLFDKLLQTSPDFYVGIGGIRGIGKTVLLLQLAARFPGSAYFSADSSHLQPYSIYDIADALRKKGIRILFIDEIHTRPGWQADIKTLYDEHEVRVFFSGSSGIDVRQSAADLSRRAVVHTLQPLSFREYLNIRKGFDIPAYSLDTILKKGGDMAIAHMRASEYLDDYMRLGGVLYSGEGFLDAMENALEKMILLDMAALRDINIKYESDARKLLYHVASSKPFEVSFSSLSQKLGVSKNFAIRLIDDMARTGLLKVVFPCKGNKKSVLQEPKIYLAIPFRMFFAMQTDRGALREEFFVNHVTVSCYFKTERGAKTPDFRVGNQRFEIGGISKTREQKADYLVVESALWEERRIPLFLFGFCY